MSQQFITGTMPNNTNQASAPYVHQAYPSYRWHVGGDTRLVQNADEDATLGDGWRDTPWPIHPESREYNVPKGIVMRSEHLSQPPAEMPATTQTEAPKPFVNNPLLNIPQAMQTAPPLPKKRGRPKKA